MDPLTLILDVAVAMFLLAAVLTLLAAVKIGTAAGLRAYRTEAGDRVTRTLRAVLVGLHQAGTLGRGLRD